MTDLSDLARRFNRAAELGRGIRLEAADVDILFAIGANDVLQQAASRQLRDECERRSAKVRSEPPAAPAVLSSDEDASEAFERARRATTRGKIGRPR